VVHNGTCRERKSIEGGEYIGGTSTITTPPMGCTDVQEDGTALVTCDSANTASKDSEDVEGDKTHPGFAKPVLI
jgi:hypothetical protein